MPGSIINKAFSHVRVNLGAAAESIRATLTGKSRQGKNVRSIPGQAYVNHNAMHKRQSTPLSTRAASPFPPKSHVQLSPADARLSALRQHNVAIGELKLHKGDAELVKTSLMHTLMGRGFSSSESQNISHALLNDPALSNLRQIERIAGTVSCSAAMYPSSFSGDISGRQRYLSLFSADMAVDQLKQHPNDLTLVHNGLQSLLLGKGFLLEDAKAAVDNLLASQTITTIKQLDSVIRSMAVKVEQQGGASLSEVQRKEALEVLGLPESASDQEIKATYRKWMLKIHPDKLTHLSVEQLRLRLQLPEGAAVKNKEALLSEAMQQYEAVGKAYRMLIP